MKVYKIKVNGKAYEVEVETVTEKAGHIESAAPAQQAAPAAAATGAQKEIKAPMAGTILNVKINVGDQIKVGDTVVILEAMKLENEVKSQVEGKVLAINVSKGSAVKNGDVMIIVG